jgi:hypothetical protein
VNKVIGVIVEFALALGGAEKVGFSVVFGEEP